MKIFYVPSFSVFLILVCLFASINTSPLQRGYAEEAEYGVRSKKPFCNAFTGCGRKRADPDVAEGELLGMLAERIQGIRDQESGYSEAEIVKRADIEDYILSRVIT
eukprot:TRINITY_DN32358_c0_g1_i1.p1 TRINITY_DN32358_c0_g1~~TRINITY_DN32358_c0_g1_i1.p1  ORF type:complete len:106 (+),score=13.42 TRINITY_DN32358_c0_g1_i1:66-383(+)